MVVVVVVVVVAARRAAAFLAAGARLYDRELEAVGLRKTLLTMRCGALATLAQRARYRATPGVFILQKRALWGLSGVVFTLLAC